jgi:hypothetical protein
MRWTWNVACKERRGMHIGYWWESQTEREQYEDQDVKRKGKAVPANRP